MASRTRGEVLGAPHPPSAVRPGGWRPAILVRKRNHFDHGQPPPKSPRDFVVAHLLVVAQHKRKPVVLRQAI